MSSTTDDDDALPSDHLEPSLVRMLLTRRHPDQRFSNDAILAATELIRKFMLEARERAAMEAECEADTDAHCGGPSVMSQDDDDDDVFGSGTGGGARNVDSITSIKPEHIARVAAEMLLDFT
uniref:Centromere protein X n=1 Tax=Minutocellus polymorphus TaxID=265543 RepID=A0A7S0FKF7_9STRA|mmetsp:Transcript_15212/g.25336  ORF Transcript_15212/g.25336 Transcript_15212/m.25336 type:complete len:122 (+) Transcript_15212:76-441(+)